MINSQHLSPSWTISINGKELSETLRLAVREIVFEERLTYTSKVEIVIEGHEGFDLKLADVPQEGELSFSVGWGSLTEELFNGELVEITPDLENNRVSTLTLIAYDRSYQLKRFRWPPETYNNGNIAGIIESILKKYKADMFGLTYEIENDAPFRDYSLSDSESGFRLDDQTDWAFLSLMAESNNMLLLVRDRTIYFVGREYFRKPRVGPFTFVIPPQLNFYYRPFPDEEADPRGLVLYHFRPRNRSLHQRDKVIVDAWHSIDAVGRKRGGKTLEEEKDVRNYTKLKVKTETVETMVVYGQAAQTTGAASLIAQAEIERRARKFVEGQGSIKGWPYVRLGQKHKFILNDLGDFGRAFSGEYFISGTEHRWTRDDGYRTLIDVERKVLT